MSTGRIKTGHTKKVIICEFHQESKPLPFTLDIFKTRRCARGQAAYALSKPLPCAFRGMIDAVEERGYELVPGLVSAIRQKEKNKEKEPRRSGAPQTVDKVPLIKLFRSMRGTLSTV